MLKTRKYNKKHISTRMKKTMRKRNNKTKRFSKKTKYSRGKRGRNGSRRQLGGDPDGDPDSQCLICTEVLDFTLPETAVNVPVRPRDARYSEAYHKNCLIDWCSTGDMTRCMDPKTREVFNCYRQLVKVPGPGVRNIAPPQNIAPQNDVDINTVLPGLLFYRTGPYNLAQAISGIDHNGVNIRRERGNITGDRILHILEQMNLLSLNGSQNLPLDRYQRLTYYENDHQLEIPIEEFTRITGITDDDVQSIIRNRNRYEGFIGYKERGMLVISPESDLTDSDSDAEGLY